MADNRRKPRLAMLFHAVSRDLVGYPLAHVLDHTFKRAPENWLHRCRQCW